MRCPGRGLPWAARTAVLAVVCTGLAWVGHTVWGGVPAAPGAFAPASVGMALLLAPFTRSRRGFGEILAVLVAAQFGLHLLFLSGSQDAASAAHHGAHHAGHALGYSPGMLAGHLTAALMAAVLLARGEAALWTLMALLGHAFRLAFVGVRPALAHHAPRLCAPDSPLLPAGPGMLRCDRPRGPPAVRSAP